ncbi:hypothetical protein AAE478_007717 [Parahypoxylon ruwenzoriense]
MLSRLGINPSMASSRHILRPSKSLARLQSTSFSTFPVSKQQDQHAADPQQPHFPVKEVVGQISVDTFRETALIPENPLLLRGFHNLPAMHKWFQYSADNLNVEFTPYMEEHEDIILPYEFTLPLQYRKVAPASQEQVLLDFLAWLEKSSKYRDSQVPVSINTLIDTYKAFKKSRLRHALPKSSGGYDNEPSHFLQLDAPLGLITSARQFNMERGNSSDCMKKLYIAQSNFSNLPEPLSQDLPTPDVVLAGKGDIYDTSIWIGLQPTFTPLHRDPNPNLFCQLAGSKKVRLTAPKAGDALYRLIRKKLGIYRHKQLRGPEMMSGPEFELLHAAVWGEESDHGDVQIDEVSLNPGDALFIPLGWWHSVASTGEDGKLNASANWWFR